MGTEGRGGGLKQTLSCAGAEASATQVSKASAPYVKSCTSSRPGDWSGSRDPSTSSELGGACSWVNNREASGDRQTWV